MTKAACSEDEFIALCRKHRSGVMVARELKMSPRGVLNRRRTIEARLGIELPFDQPNFSSHQYRETQRGLETLAKTLAPKRKRKITDAKRALFSAPKSDPDAIEHVPSDWRYEIRIRAGVVVVGSDAHYKPNVVSTAHRALVAIVKRLRPAVVVMNGDMFDGSGVSRHFRIRWEKIYQVKDELEACIARMGEVEAVAGNAKLIRTWGNHDSNWETRLSGHVPQYEGVGGFTLWEHLPRWQPCMSVFVNGQRGLVIKHRFKGGMHAPHNNVLWGGRHMATGHLHSQKIMPITNYNGTLYGVDTGCLASPDDAAFHYAEDDPRNWRSGFGVFTFADGEMLPPELVTVIGKDRVWFRGEVIHV